MSDAPPDVPSDEGGPREEDPAPAPRRRRMPVLVEVLVAVVVVAVVQALVIKPFVVPSGSMENTLHVGDRILVNRLDSSIARQDVVVFGHGRQWQDPRLPDDPNPVKRALKAIGDAVQIGPSNTTYTVKRVIGLPGDTVGCCDVQGRVEVNGKALVEPYVFEDWPFTPGALDCTTSPRSSRCLPTIRVPKDSYLVLGDHRSHSDDSVMACRGTTSGDEACARFVPVERVVGPVVFRIWPVGSIGGIG